MATMGMGNAAVLTLSAGGVGLGIASGAAGNEEAAAMLAEKNMRTSFEQFTMRISSAFGDEELVTPNRMTTLGDSFFRHGDEGAASE